MNATGLNVVQNMLSTVKACDPNFTDALANEILDIYKGHKNCPSNETDLDVVLTRNEVSHIISRGTDTVDAYCRQGVFRRVKLPTAKRAIGISAASVAKALGMTLKQVLTAKEHYNSKRYYSSFIPQPSLMAKVA